MRTIAVTGAASGIGAAIAEQLRDEGHRVITVDLHDADVVADLCDSRQRQTAVQSVRDISGGVLNGLVCSAGLSAFGQRHPGAEGKIISVNYFGAVDLLLGLQPDLARANDPSAVLVSSWAQFRPTPLPAAVEACLAGDEARAVELVETDARPGVDRAAYPTSKIAMVTKVRLLAGTAEWAGNNITLNATVPSVTDSAMTAQRLSTTHGREDLLRRSPIPLGRIATAHEQADPVAYLVGGRGRYISGQVICVDGGLDAVRRPLDPIQPLEMSRWT